MTTSDIHIHPMTSSPDVIDRNAAHTLVAAPGYERLAKVLIQAHHQAAFGKGLERHANSLPFEKQRMLSISHLLDSPDGMAYQVTKKMTAGLAMNDFHRCTAELYGAINYLAGIVVFLEDKQAALAPAACTECRK